MKKSLMLGLILLFALTSIGFAANTMEVPEEYNMAVSFKINGIYHYAIPYIGIGKGQDTEGKKTLTEAGSVSAKLKCMAYYWQNIDTSPVGSASKEENHYLNGKIETAIRCPEQKLAAANNPPGAVLIFIDFAKKTYSFTANVIIDGVTTNYSDLNGNKGSSNTKEGIKHLLVKDIPLPANINLLSGKKKFTLNYDGKDPKADQTGGADENDGDNPVKTKILEDKLEIDISWEFKGSANKTQMMIMPGVDFSAIMQQNNN